MVKQGHLQRCREVQGDDESRYAPVRRVHVSEEYY